MQLPHFPFLRFPKQTILQVQAISCEGRAWKLSKIPRFALATALSSPIQAYPLAERIYNLNAIDFPDSLHVFREQNLAASLFGGPNDQSAPKGKSVKAVEIYCGKNVCQVRLNYVELGKQSHFAASKTWIDVQLASDGRNIPEAPVAKVRRFLPDDALSEPNWCISLTAQLAAFQEAVPFLGTKPALLKSQ